MANIQSYLDQIANAVYGEEIRSSIINSLQKVNDDNDSYADLKKEVIAARDDINDQVDQFDKKMEAASEISKKLEEDTASGNQTHSDLTNSITTAQSERSKLESAYENVGKVVESANEKKDALDASISSANTAKTNLDGSVTTAKGDTRTTETANERVAVSWRGTENPWGNIWKFVYGINFYCTVDKPFEGYVCTDLNFAESKNSGNYENIGFTLPSANGYISAIGYSTKYDWLFLPSEVTGNSSLPVGDYYYQNNTWNGYRIALLGGRWNDWGGAGGFVWFLSNGVGTRARAVGGRLVLIPTKDSAVYMANITAWKQKMAA